MKSYCAWMAADFRRHQTFTAMAKEWIKKHNSGACRLRDGKALRSKMEVDVVNTSSTRLHRPQTCFVPEDCWPEQEYGPPDPSKRTEEVLEEGGAPVPGYLVTGGWGKANHWLIDDYQEKKVVKRERVEDGNDVVFENQAGNKYVLLAKKLSKASTDQRKKTTEVKTMSNDDILTLIAGCQKKETMSKRSTSAGEAGHGSEGDASGADGDSSQDEAACSARWHNDGRTYATQ